MLEPPRIGLPNLLGQGELMARMRSATAGADSAARDAIAASLQQEAVRRAEELPAAQRVERTGEDPHEHDQGGRQGGRRGAEDGADPDDPEDGPLVDVTA